MRNTQIAARLFNTPLLAQEHYAQVVASFLARRGLNIEAPLAPEQSLVERPARDPMLTQSGILVVPIVGALMHRGDALDAMSGAESYTHLNNLVVRALEMEECRGILLDIDSPGGQVGGCFDFADTLLDARRVKPIWGIANSMACSAAYAIGASAGRLYASPSATAIGSIGVVWMHLDVSEMLEKAGIVTTFVYAGKHKIDGTPYKPLPKSVKAEFQADIDAHYEQFVDLVAKRRPISPEAIRSTEARCFRAQEAADLNLVDGVLSFAATLAAFEEELGSGKRTQHVINTTENPTMTQPAANAPATQPPAAVGVAQADHERAVEAARVSGYRAGRTDAGAILASEHAKSRGGLAAKLIADPDMTVAKATDYLQAAPAEATAPTGLLKQAMLGNNPKVGAGDDEPADARAERKAELAAVGKNARKF